MNCPICSKELKIPNKAYNNVETYRQPQRVTTECCGSIIILSCKTVYNVVEYTGNATEDDWGVKASNKKRISQNNEKK